jgi:hypothetical protein
VRALLVGPSLVLAAVAWTGSPAFAAPTGNLEGYVPVAASVHGKFGSFWTTDLWIYTQSATTVHLWYNPSDHDNTDVSSMVLTLQGPVTYVHDVVGSMFQSTGKGSLHYLADGEVVVLSKTWTPATQGGTYGQMAYGVPLADASAAGSGQVGSLRMLVNLTQGFRVNVGLVNVTGVPVTVSLEAFLADGSPVPGFTPMNVTLQPYDMQQLDAIFAALGGASYDGVAIRATVTSTEGAIVSYVSQVDDTTNSGSYQQAFRFGF